jgi:hypothetical protein
MDGLGLFMFTRQSSDEIFELETLGIPFFKAGGWGMALRRPVFPTTPNSPLFTSTIPQHSGFVSFLLSCVLWILLLRIPSFFMTTFRVHLSASPKKSLSLGGFQP